MKFLTIFFALFLIALPLEAQHGGEHGGGGGGFHGGGGGFHGGTVGGFHGGAGSFHGGGFRSAPVGGFRGNVGGFHGNGFRGGPVNSFHGGGFHSGAVRGFHGGGFHDNGFHSGFFGNRFVISPFFGFGFGYGYPYYAYAAPYYPYYSEPDYSGAVYVNPPSYDSTSTVAPTGQATQPQQPATVIVVLKNGTRFEAPGYALVGSTLWILDGQNARKVSINDVDRDATQKANQERGVDVVIPSP
jgi:hypothetical protein